MDFDFSKTSEPISPAPIALNTVYVVNADPTYDVHKACIAGNDFIALRTLTGKGNIKIDDCEEITVTPYTLLFCEHKKIKRYYCSDKIWSFWWFEFTVSNALDLPLNTLLHFHAVDNEIQYFNICLEMLRIDNYISKPLASATFAMLIYQWMMHWYNKSKHTNPYQIVIEKIIAYVKANPAGNITIKAMADMAGLSERRFREIFKSITGQQPKKFVNTLRLNIAEELLKNTPLSINEIAFRLGYCSQFHFSRAFQKAHGISPSRFRRS